MNYFVISLMKKSLLILLLTLIALVSGAQDTITIMHYNLLNYGNYTSYCTSSNNNHEQKDTYLRTITGHVNPDIFTVNEISQYEFYHNRILTEVLNVSGKDYYRKAAITNIADSYIINGLFYDSRKLVLYSQAVMQSYVRDINLYRLYFRSPSLAKGDTVFINCIVAHLKASSGSSNEEARAVMTNSVMNWLKTNMMPGNFLIMGDFNVYTSSEQAYQNLVNPPASNQGFRFYDPVDKPGDWNNNFSFAAWHTQSVSSSGNGCQASGGMDDRFDFILASAGIMQGNKGARYIPESYKALGQDGKHFNRSINDSPQNTSVPSGVLSALAVMSDHLPVIMKLKIDSGPTGGITGPDVFKNAFVYRGDDRMNYLCIYSDRSITVETGIYDLAGNLKSTGIYPLCGGRNDILIETDRLMPGFYLLNIRDKSGNDATIKLAL
ncbi:hypothetical protein SDC9_24432 [bioreactor metagenome]|jgi:endonuclease/exonuclease/phosphatase family metal-dependent hydrolase|uniref:Endonuclease n=3 Tax=root TaxID=1 RepID=A0A0S7BZL8_9BACT|nr:endonuclease [Lentimicrobium saccharophilum]